MMEQVPRRAPIPARCIVHHVNVEAWRMGLGDLGWERHRMNGMDVDCVIVARLEGHLVHLHIGEHASPGRKTA